MRRSNLNTLSYYRSTEWQQFLAAINNLFTFIRFRQADFTDGWWLHWKRYIRIIPQIHLPGSRNLRENRTDHHFTEQKNHFHSHRRQKQVKWTTVYTCYYANYILQHMEDLLSRNMRWSMYYVQFHENTFKWYLNLLLTGWSLIIRWETFCWHPPTFFSSDFGHVTPPLSFACHVTVRWCCRRRGGCACLCHGWGWGIWIVSGLLLGRLSGTSCYRGLQSWCSGSLPCVYYTPTGDESFRCSLGLCLRARSVSPM